MSPQTPDSLELHEEEKDLDEDSRASLSTIIDWNDKGGIEKYCQK